MRVIFARNVNDAYRQGIEEIRENGVAEPSRVGPVQVVPYPVTTVYMKPLERVLFDETRDANPFFHLFESFWMLSGAKNARWMDDYVKGFSSRYDDPPGSGDNHGAYGYRWRKHFELDQLLEVGEMLRKDPMTRRVVLGMWDPAADLNAQKRDLPCNTQIYFITRPNLEGPWDSEKGSMDRVLDMTVCNRSNDIIWGAYGANSVHMSVLHEAVAALAGMEVGKYYQMSNNFHAYEDTLAKVDMPSDEDPYAAQAVEASPLFDRWSIGPVIKYIPVWMDNPYNRHTPYKLFNDILTPMAMTHRAWKLKDWHTAFSWCREITAGDWRAACEEWLERRQKKANAT